MFLVIILIVYNLVLFLEVLFGDKRLLIGILFFLLFRGFMSIIFIYFEKNYIVVGCFFYFFMIFIRIGYIEFLISFFYLR